MLLGLLPERTEFGFLIASVVCRVSPNISNNELEVAQLDAFRSQLQMPGLCGSLGGWGGRELGKGWVQGPQSWSLGVSHSKDMRVPTMCQVTYGHWEGRTLPTRHCHGWLPMTDRVAVETSATPTTQSAGSSLRGSMARDLDSDRPGCQGSGSSILIYYCYYLGPAVWLAES